ncbi:hypothetical protein, partial [Denitromonas iodatirespirans]
MVAGPVGAEAVGRDSSRQHPPRPDESGPTRVIDPNSADNSIRGSALTYASGALAAGTGTLLLTPVGWLIVGVVLVGGSIYLGFV